MIILGLSWLWRYNPTTSWREAQITHWNKVCFPCCIPAFTLLPLWTVSVKDTSIPELPTVYHDLCESFSKTKASELPPHRPSDCAIDLLSSRSLLRSVYLPCHLNRRQWMTISGRNWLRTLFNLLAPQPQWASSAWRRIVVFAHIILFAFKRETSERRPSPQAMGTMNTRLCPSALSILLLSFSHSSMKFSEICSIVDNSNPSENPLVLTLVEMWWKHE